MREGDSPWVTNLQSRKLKVWMKRQSDLEWVETVVLSWVLRRLPGRSGFEGFSGGNSVGRDPKVRWGGSVLGTKKTARFG